MGWESIKMLLTDVDGVLTDGRVFLDHEGREMKAFHVWDGLGLVLLQRAGLLVGIISGSDAPLIRHRARQLGITEVYTACLDKKPALDEILARHQLRPEQVCFVGDDLLDLPLFRCVGMGVAVANARPEALAAARYVTAAQGGAGAVREVAELILKTQGRWEEVLAAAKLS